MRKRSPAKSSAPPHRRGNNPQCSFPTLLSPAWYSGLSGSTCATIRKRRGLFFSFCCLLCWILVLGEITNKRRAKGPTGGLGGLRAHTHRRQIPLFGTLRPRPGKKGPKSAISGVGPKRGEKIARLGDSGQQTFAYHKHQNRDRRVSGCISRSGIGLWKTGLWAWR